MIVHKNGVYREVAERDIKKFLDKGYKAFEQVKEEQPKKPTRGKGK